MKHSSLLILFLLLSACGGGGTSSNSNINNGGLPAPTGLVAVALSSSQVDLSWTPAPGNEGVVAYEVYRNGKLVATTMDNQYTDTGLFAETSFEYTIASVDGANNVSQQSDSSTVSTLAFILSDVAIGDPNISYANVEFTGDGKYMVWFELQNSTGRGTVWHCGVDPVTGELIPANGKGFRAFESSLLGRANTGMDSSGAYYVGMERTGKMILVKPTGPTSASISELQTLPDLTRRAIYPSDLPNQNTGRVLWIKNEAVPGNGLEPGNSWFELQYINLADPATINVIERQDKPAIGFAPMDIGFPRWYRDKDALIYGFFDTNTNPDIQVRELDFSDPSGTPHEVTNDPTSKIDPSPFTIDGQDIILAGINGTATSHVYQRSNGNTLFLLAETMFPPDSNLQNPALAQSHERIINAGRIYSTYQVNEQGSSFFDTAFSQTGEIWLTTVLQTPQQQWRLSEESDTAKAEPEPYFGTSKVWVFYSSLPKGSDYLNTVWTLRRAETPLGKQ